MSFIAIYGVFTLLVLTGVFLAAYKTKGLPFAFIATGVALVALGVMLAVAVRAMTEAMS